VSISYKGRKTDNHILQTIITTTLILYHTHSALFKQTKKVSQGYYNHLIFWFYHHCTPEISYDCANARNHPCYFKNWRSLSQT